MAKDWQAIYFQLGALAAEMPKDLAGPAPVTQDMYQWMGRASALVNQVCGPADSAIMASACNGMSGTLRTMNAGTIAAIVYRALAIAEANAPAAAQGAFIPAGHGFDVFAAIGRILGAARQEVLIVDPYMDEKALTDFAPLAPEPVRICLLADQGAHKPSLPPAAARWRAQYVNTRPLEVRLAPARSLHDRLIVIDGHDVWTLTQSLNAFAARSPGTIVKVDAETAAMKAPAFQAIWQAAAPI